MSSRAQTLRDPTSAQPNCNLPVVACVFHGSVAMNAPLLAPHPPGAGPAAAGTYITRSDVLRGQSWELAQADTSRSTRGGSVQPSHVHKRRKLDARAEKWAPAAALLWAARRLLPHETRRCQCPAA